MTVLDLELAAYLRSGTAGQVFGLVVKTSKSPFRAPGFCERLQFLIPTSRQCRQQHSTQGSPGSGFLWPRPQPCEHLENEPENDSLCLLNKNKRANKAVFGLAMNMLVQTTHPTAELGLSSCSWCWLWRALSLGGDSDGFKYWVPVAHFGDPDWVPGFCL